MKLQNRQEGDGVTRPDTWRSGMRRNFPPVFREQDASRPPACLPAFVGER